MKKADPWQRYSRTNGSLTCKTLKVELKFQRKTWSNAILSVQVNANPCRSVQFEGQNVYWSAREFVRPVLDPTIHTYLSIREHSLSVLWPVAQPQWPSSDSPMWCPECLVLPLEFDRHPGHRIGTATARSLISWNKKCVAQTKFWTVGIKLAFPEPRAVLRKWKPGKRLFKGPEETKGGG